MKKIFFSLVITILMLVGCSIDSDKTAEETKEVSEEVIAEEPTETEEEVVEEPVVKKTYFTLEEFNKLFQLDPEETQYENGKFELMDGTIVNADYLWYEKSNLFEYAAAIFYQGELAFIQMETKAKPEEIESVFGVKMEDYKPFVKETSLGYEIIFNDLFFETNIKIYPNEWN